MTVIQMDTREKTAKKNHITGYFDKTGIRYIRSKLYVGDYTRIDNQTTCIDVKQNMQEVYSNVINTHERFRNECKRAQDAGIHLVILIEEPNIGSIENVHTWKNPRLYMWEHGKLRTQKKPPATSQKLQTIMKALSDRYGVEWMFCKQEDTGKCICEILKVRQDK